VPAFSTLLLAIGLALGTIIRGGSQSFTWIYEHFLGLVTASIVYSILQTAVLYFWSFKEDKLLALGGNSESHIYNVCQPLIILYLGSYVAFQFWIGRELNPTIGSLDLKSFCELRPGLIGWVLINISMACEQAVRSGGHITDSMLLILIFQGSYVFDALYNEVRFVSLLFFPI
jgi:Delta14-sterol reductase